MASHDKTEKATPKKREEARKRGQVARSADLNGAAVLLAGLLALSAFGPAMLDRMKEATIAVLQLTSSPEVVDKEGVGSLMAGFAQHVLLAAAPIAVVCALAGACVSAAQVGIKPMPGAIKPDFKKLNPLTGAKNLFGTHALFEGVKNVVKVAAVGAIVALAVFPKLDEMAALVGMPAAEMLSHLASLVFGIAQRAALAYLVIGAVDYVWQRHKHEKGLRMDKQEVKDEHKQQELPAELKSAQRRRAMEMARGRMMEAVPTADVVVTNPTHYSVALRYDAEHLAPIVVAKGQDHIALRIRSVAAEHGVAVIPDPPLARALHGSVEVGHMIPEELYQAVAQLLAYVYRVAGRAAA
jgi:flagellar biosynthetic protein FlhB